ncbi:MAG: DegT/DnrJ/EryC1/StrS family aminotransferase [Lachnospiraceae bacterium]|jgi:dTDP-4-amino-4,6-dideoxygalactose transaminase
MNVPFSPPDITEAEIQEVSDALRSGWITTGPRTKELEKEVAAFTGSAKAACLSSATACEEMALRLFGIGEGDEVIVPAYTYTATAAAACHVGATVRMVDCAPGSFEPDYDAIESMVNERTKAIIPVDLGGVMCDYDRLRDIVEKKKSLYHPTGRYQEALGHVMILADSAHGFGASRVLENPIYGGGKQLVKSGQAADVTSFSFHAVKNFTTAEGGALTWRPLPGIDDEEIYRMLMLMTLHGQSKDALAKTKPGSWEYDIVGTWYKCNMTDVHAAIGLAQMKRYPGLLARRRELIGRYEKGLAGSGAEVMKHFREGVTSSGHLMIVRVPKLDEAGRNELIIHMAEDGVATNVHYKPLPMHTAYKKLGFDIQDFPNAYDQYRCEITLPLHTKLTDEQNDYVIRELLKWI